MNTWQLLDLLMRGATIGLLCFIAGLFFRFRPISPRTFSVVFLTIGLACYTLISSMMVRMLLGEVTPALIFMATLNPVLLWWSCNSLFDDRFRFQYWHLLPLGLIIAPGYLEDWWQLAESARGVLIIILYLHLLWVAIRTAPIDLVEERRVFRTGFLAATAVFGIGVTFVEIQFSGDALPFGISVLQSCVLLFLTLSFAFWASSLDRGNWLVTEDNLQPFAQEVTKEALSATDRALLTHLEAAMADGIWWQEGLTIGMLAANLDVPEHRLRGIINRHLGYRNFARFINERRVKAACEYLDDPKRSGGAILTIAFDVGFASIGPFNRAFRDITGQSPSEYLEHTTSKS